jgi:hypothetical protein
MSYAERGKLVGAVADVLIANRARYEDIAIANSGNTKTDAAIDIDGGIGTLKYYARLGAGLGDARMLLDEKPVRLAKAENYQAIHLMMPRRGVAIHINAFNFRAGDCGRSGGVAARGCPGSCQARLVDRASGARDGEGRDRRQGAAGRRVEPALRRRRRSCSTASRPMTSLRSPARRHRAAGARPCQRGGEERAGQYRADSINAHSCAGLGARERGLRRLRARGRTRDHGQGRAEMYGDHGASSSPSAGRPMRLPRRSRPSSRGTKVGDPAGAADTRNGTRGDARSAGRSVRRHQTADRPEAQVISAAPTRRSLDGIDGARSAFVAPDLAACRRIRPAQGRA